MQNSVNRQRSTRRTEPRPFERSAVNVWGSGPVPIGAKADPGMRSSQPGPSDRTLLVDSAHRHAYSAIETYLNLFAKSCVELTISQRGLILNFDDIADLEMAISAFGHLCSDPFSS